MRQPVATQAFNYTYITLIDAEQEATVLKGKEKEIARQKRKLAVSKKVRPTQLTTDTYTGGNSEIESKEEGDFSLPGFSSSVSNSDSARQEY